jgi:serine/threonine protein kinase
MPKALSMRDLGNYRVLDLLGEGGMGKVYAAEEKLSGRRVALKVLRPELAASAEGRALFVREMRILAQLDHPAVVRSLASVEHEGELALVLEYLEGSTLRAALASGPLAPSKAAGIASHIAQALHAAHSRTPPIVHRDLKPENVMLLPSGAVKVMDFGVAKVLESLHGSVTRSVGTLQYMSPEQIDARPLDHRTDLYSLGLVLYELIAGVPPFQSASPRELLHLACTAEPPPLPADARERTPSGLAELTFALLAKAPNERPSSAAEVIARLAPFVPATAASPPSTPSLNAAAPALAPTAALVTSPLAALAPPAEAPLAPRARGLSTGWLVALLVGVSVLAGAAAYLARAVFEPAPVTKPRRGHAAP